MTSVDFDLSTASVPSGARLSFDHLSMTFPDGTHAIDDVSFTVAPGEFTTVVGPSGCGKSTLLRIASGLERGYDGGCDVDRDSIGYVFQDATLLPWRTVRRNVELNAELQSGVYDVVIAPYSEHGAVESGSQSVSATYLPVAMNKDEAEIASADYSKVMVADKDELKHYLKAIHKTLKTKT